MTLTIRPARPEDAALIAPWTADTFEWGDYVAERLPGWIEDPDCMPLVTAGEDDLPVAVANTLMLSPTEAWLEGARVHPDHQRSGLGSALNRAGTSWARDRGALVARLATEADNVAAQRQVEALGYRHASSWLHAEPDPRGEPMATSSMQVTGEVDPVWLYWSVSELALIGRELIALGWRWRRTTIEDLARAAARGQLYQSSTGWAIVEEPEEGWVRVGWLATAQEDAPSLFEALKGLTRDRGATEMTIMVPNAPWFAETLRRAGVETSVMLIYSLSLS